MMQITKLFSVRCRDEIDLLELLCKMVSCFISGDVLCQWQLCIVSRSLETAQLPVISKVILSVGKCFVTSETSSA